jgi:ATP-dependent DNA helicase RecG
MTLSSPVTAISGIGEVLSKKLERLQIYTVFDLLYHLPFRYEDRSRIVKTTSVQAGETATVIGTIDKIKNTYTKNGKFIQTASITDSSGSLAVIWFNQMFLSRTIPPGTNIALYGKVEFYNHKPTLFAPEYEVINSSLNIESSTSSLIHTGRLVPVYPETAGVTSKWFRNKIFHLLNTLDLSDFYPLPPDYQNLASSLRNIHFPSTLSDIETFRRRLAFDELFLLQTTALLRKDSWKKTKLSHAFAVNREKVDDFISSLPFTLTQSQSQSVSEILSDLKLSHAANRLLEGDVGSGKTVVAAIAAYVAHLNGFQTLIMAPTQILAAQHHQTLTGLFQPFRIEIGLITSNSSSKMKNSELEIVVGTHAILSKNFSFDRIGLVVIDEQHRFGVAQRALATQIGKTPHVLTMTATPIPRTVALSLYGDLDLSVLNQVPTGRLPIKTWVVPENKRQAGYMWIEKQITENKTQCFVVCPFIDDSETMTSIKSATTEFNKLKEIFPKLKLGLLHGKLKSDQKNSVINSFRSGETQILVATPVVEVGIDIPNATIMLIEGADRFGLAQLHQLRGRVGRGSEQSYCLLYSTEPDLTRLKAMQTHNSGLELAEIDLRIRGPGQIYGIAQHGSPQFKIANYSDLSLIEQTKLHSQKIFSNLQKYPVLRSLIKEDKISIVQPN